MTSGRPSGWAQRSLLLAACLLVPACSKVFEFPDTPGASAVVLMQDDFSGGVGTNWETLTPTSNIDSAAGNNPPSLQLKAGTAAATVMTTQRYTTLRGLTVAVDVQLNGVTSSEIIIIDKDNMTSIRTLMIISKTGATLWINGQSQSTTWTDGNGFHRYTFSLTPAGDAQWTRDGNILMTGRYPVTDIFVKLLDFGSGSNFDNVLITAP